MPYQPSNSHIKGFKSHRGIQDSDKESKAAHIHMGTAQNTLHASWALWLPFIPAPWGRGKIDLSSRVAWSPLPVPGQPGKEKLSQNKPQTHKTTPYAKSKSHIHKDAKHRKNCTQRSWQGHSNSVRPINSKENRIQSSRKLCRGDSMGGWGYGIIRFLIWWCYTWGVHFIFISMLQNKNT